MPLGCRPNRRFAYVLVLVLALTLLAGVADARADISFRADYENGTCCDSNGWHDVQYEFDRPMTDSFSIVTNPVRQGHYAAKVVVQQGYSPFGWNESTEAAKGMTDQGEGSDYYYAWSTMFDPSWVSPYGWGDIVQFYTDNYDKFGGPPPVSLDTSGTGIVLSVLAGRFDEPGTSADAWRGWYTHPGTSTPSLIGYSFNQNYQVLNTLSLGQWNDFVMHIHWSAHNGQIQMWHRLPGQSWIEVLSINVPTLRYDPQTNVSDDIGLLKQGLYRQSYCQQPTVVTACNSTMGLQPPDILYQDAFVRGSTFDEVVAAAFDDSGSGQSAPSAPAPPAASSPPPASQSSAPTAPTGPDQPLVGNLSPTTDSGCSGCAVSTSRGPGDVDATIAGGLDSLDTAYELADFGGAAGWSGRVWTRDAIALASSTALGGNLSVLQQRDVNGSLVWEIYVDGSNRQISLWSPAGGLGSSAINQSTGVVMDGQSHTVEVSALPNDSVVVRVDGQDRITLTGLSGSTSGNLRFLRIGIDHYDTGTSNEAISISHSNVGVSTLGWLGSRVSPLGAASTGSSGGAGTTSKSTAGGGGGGSAAADLSLALSATPAVPTGTVTYTAVVSDVNHGSGSNLLLTLNLPAGATVVSMSADRGAGCKGTTHITCSLDWISGSLVAHVTITARVPAGAQLTATGSVSETEPDPNLKNNSASVTVDPKVAFGEPSSKPSGSSASSSGVTGKKGPSLRRPVVFVVRPSVAGRHTVLVRLAARPRVRLQIIIRDARGRSLGASYAVSTRKGRSSQLIALHRWEGQAKLNVIVRSAVAGHTHSTNMRIRLSKRELAACRGAR